MSASSARSAVAIGGGTGLPLVLRSLYDLGWDPTAIVTMADDGGSSGALRRELGMLPPGDIRNCLVALADEDQVISRLFQYRFPGGEGLAGHALGNLIIAGLTEVTGSFPAALETAADLLGVRGTVLPCTLDDIVLHAVNRSGEPVAGQASIASSSEPVTRVMLEPSSPAPYPPVLEAIARARLIVIGPGSLFTSIVPNFLVDGVAEAVRQSPALKVYVCNVANQRGETCGMGAADHVTALVDHGLAGAIDVALVDDGSTCGPGSAAELQTMCDDDARGIERIALTERDAERIAALGVDVRVGPLVDPQQPLRHDRVMLREALKGVV